jgi:hypothetical protein
MWICAKCREDVDEDFDVCWSCGTTREGRENTEFNPETEGIINENVYRAQRAAMQYEDLVTVATFGSAPEAHMARSRLESEGIHAFVTDELAGNALGLFPALSGIRLQVAGKDAARAHALLAEVPHLRPEPIDEETRGAPDDQEQDEYDDDDADSEEGIKE